MIFVSSVVVWRSHRAVLEEALARAREIPLSEAAETLIGTDELKPPARRAMGAFLSDLARWRGLAETQPHPELAAQLLDESGYTAMWQADKSPDAPGRLENLKDLSPVLEEFAISGPIELQHIYCELKRQRKVFL